jgi:hypothetical protein
MTGEPRVGWRLARGVTLAATVWLAVEPVAFAQGVEGAEASSTPTTFALDEPKPETGYPTRGLAIYPAGPGKDQHRWAIGGLWQIAPMFTASYERGLDLGFTVDATVQTIVLYNQLGVGGQWAAQVGPFSLGVMLHLNVFFGTLGKALIATTQFNAVGWGLLLDPGVKAGLRLTSDSWLTFQIEHYFSLYQWQKLGSLTISPNAASYAGLGMSLLVEYAPKHEGVIYYGASLYHTATNYPIWMNVEATPESEPFSSQKIWYLGVLAGYEF